MENSITKVEQFNEFVKKFQQENKMPYAFGIGLAFKDLKQDTIAHKWLSLNVEENLGSASVLMDALNVNMEQNSPFYLEFTTDDEASEANDIIQKYFTPFVKDGKYHENIDALNTIWGMGFFKVRGVVIFYPTKEIFDREITSNADAHFRLSAMSRLKFKPNTICLDNLFSILQNLVYESNGNVSTIEDWNQNYWASDCGRILVDKIPLLTWGAPVPLGVRVVNPDNVRLGAYLSPGTTIMHYGFVNFNAGTLGKSMVEGRISAGTTIDDGTDIGAGAGFLGTLSGGNSLKLSAGKDCLIGANAECGVILGNNCVVATGTCFSQNTPIVEILPDKRTIVRKVKDFNGKNNLTFRKHAITGQLEVIQRGNKAILNEELHISQ